MSLTEAERARARKAIVEDHIRCESLHDVEATMATFGMEASYDDEPVGRSVRRKRQTGVRAHLL